MKTDAGTHARRLDQLLIACVREHDWREPLENAAVLLSSVDQDRLLLLADQHRVDVAVWLSLGNSGALRADIHDRLVERRRAATMNQLLIELELTLVSRSLSDMPWLVVKGPALAHGYYRRPELRSYADLDVLVPPARLAEAVHRLETAGYVLVDRNWTLLSRRLSGELHLMSKRGLMVDLHWDLFNDRATRDSYGMVTTSFFERSASVRVGGKEVPTLDELDTMIHTAVHAARSGGDRLVWMKDLEQLVLARRFTWDELATRCAEHHAQLAVSVMLHRMRSTFNMPEVTDAVLRDIGGRTFWRALGRFVDRFAPVARANSNGSLTRMYARATRADSRGTGFEFARRLTSRARRGAWHTEDYTWNAKHPQSVLYDSGGAEAKESFFRAVGSLR